METAAATVARPPECGYTGGLLSGNVSFPTTLILCSATRATPAQCTPRFSSPCWSIRASQSLHTRTSMPWHSSLKKFSSLNWTECALDCDGLATEFVEFFNRHLEQVVSMLKQNYPYLWLNCTSESLGTTSEGYWVLFYHCPATSTNLLTRTWQEQENQSRPSSIVVVNRSRFTTAFARSSRHRLKPEINLAAF
jgi:hypothetical protein